MAWLLHNILCIHFLLLKKNFVAEAYNNIGTQAIWIPHVAWYADVKNNTIILY